MRQLLNNQGYIVADHKTIDPGADILAYDCQGNLKEAAQVWNWQSPHSYANTERFQNTIDPLLQIRHICKAITLKLYMWHNHLTKAQRLQCIVNDIAIVILPLIRGVIHTDDCTSVSSIHTDANASCSSSCFIHSSHVNGNEGSHSGSHSGCAYTGHAFSNVHFGIFVGQKLVAPFDCSFAGMGRGLLSIPCDPATPQSTTGVVLSNSRSHSPPEEMFD